MKITINDVAKCDKFVAIFQQLKTLSATLCWQIDEDSITIQGMDQGHVAMFQLVLGNTWFDDYTSNLDISEFHICSNLLAKFLNTRSDHQTIDINLDDSGDKIKIKFKSDNKSEFNKSFMLPLIDAEQENLNIPDMEYSAEFSMESKKLNSLIDQLSLMDDVVNIHCDEESIKFTAEGLDGKMDVYIPHDDIEEYIIEEDASLNVRFSLGYMKKFCQYHKVSDAVEIQISEEYPLMVIYKLNALNYLKFYLAPKINDSE
jgi:proliferating cell nuclear antigen